MKSVQRRVSHHTQWAAQFAVASELCKKGYEVALTMGNHPNKDLLVVSPSGVSFAIDVKGIYRKNWWLLRPKALDPNLYYVFAYVPENEVTRFFVLTQAQVNAEIAAASAAAHQRGEEKGLPSNFDKLPGISWPASQRYEGAWEILPK